jgi:chromosome segregation ATPase
MTQQTRAITRLKAEIADLEAQHGPASEQMRAFNSRFEELTAEVERRKAEIKRLEAASPDLAADTLLGDKNAAKELLKREQALREARLFVERYEQAYPVFLKRIEEAADPVRSLSRAIGSRQEELWRHEEAEERAVRALAELRDAA